jgi:hypothetical protein
MLGSQNVAAENQKLLHKSKALGDDHGLGTLGASIKLMLVGSTTQELEALAKGKTEVKTRVLNDLDDDAVGPTGGGKFSTQLARQRRAPPKYGFQNVEVCFW